MQNKTIYQAISFIWLP